jgi:hypothetical protein
MKPESWLLLIHQIPWKPGYLRVKIGRRLQRVGAVAIKNTVYVLPMSDQSMEDFQWIMKEIVTGGGEAYLCQSHFVGGLSDEQVIHLFQADREADYAELAKEVQELLANVPEAAMERGGVPQIESEVKRLRRIMAEINALNFFSAPSQPVVESLLTNIESRLHKPVAVSSRKLAGNINAFQGKVWVTRKGLQIDRMASGWLIQRFIDPQAQFKFVSAESYQPQSSEIRFDMFNAEFTHEGEHCTFEVLLDSFGLNHDPALRLIGEIVHDIDLKDEKFGRTEVPGIDHLMAGIALASQKMKPV